MMMQKNFSLSCSSARRHDDGDDQTKQTNGFSEDEDQDHSYEELGLDCVHADSHVSYDSNGETWGLNNN